MSRIPGTRSRYRLPVGCLAALAGLLLAAPGVGGQERSLTAQAQRLQDAGEFWAASSTLRAHLWRQPGDGYARFRLGQLLYWLGRPDEAMVQYDSASALLPEEPWPRIGRARVLMDRGELAGAAEALDRALARTGNDPGAMGEASALRGTVSYWQGDRSRAVRHFEAALDQDPGRDDVLRQLAEIRSATRPWAATHLETLDDNQPHGRRTAGVEGGVWLTPLWTLSAGAAPTGFEAAGASTAGEAWTRLAGFLPGPRVDVSARLGRAWQAGVAGHGGAWTGDATVSVPVARDLRVRGRAWAERYLWTRASVDTLFLARGAELALDAAGAPGWAGELVLRRERLDATNAIRTAYLWVLAPVLPWLRGGYALSWQDSDESRWVADATSNGPSGPGRGPGGPGPGSEASGGQYLPYFTPERTSVHALLAEALRPVGRGMARVNLSYGVRAREMAPVAEVGGSGASATVRTVFGERSFTPWSVRASFEAPAGCCALVRGELERGRTAFYEMTRVSLGVTYRFLGSPGPAPS